MKILTIGGATVDIFFTQENADIQRVTSDQRAHLMVTEGAKVIMKDAHIATGGGATNAAAVMSTLGMQVTSCCIVGEDPFGQFVTQRLATHNIDTRHIHTTEQAPTAISCIMPSPTANRTILVYRGANAYITADHLPENLDAYDGVYITSIAQQAAPHIAEIAQRTQEAHAYVAHNPGSEELENATQALCQALAYIDIFILNAREARQLTSYLGQDQDCIQRLCAGAQPEERNNTPRLLADFDTIAETYIDVRAYMREMMHRGCSTVVVTNGSEGVYVGHEDTLYFASAPSTDVTCSVGAGDACGSTFFAYRLRGTSIPDALVRAIRNSCHVLQTLDAKRGAASHEDLTDIETDHVSTFPLSPNAD